MALTTVSTITVMFINFDEAAVAVQGMDRRLPSGHLTGWNFSELTNNFVGSNAFPVQLHAVLNGWLTSRESLISMGTSSSWSGRRQRLVRVPLRPEVNRRA